MIADVPIPRRMRRLKRDRRGYPIPANVLIDANGRAHFTVNDEMIRHRQLLEDRCPICDGLLTIERWFVGGSQSAFNPRGAYIDIPMHDECAHYALQVCPYLAAPSYTREIGARTLGENSGIAAITVDNTAIPGRPAGEVFVAVQARATLVIDGGRYVKPAHPYRRVEFWQHGKKITREVAEAATNSKLAET